MRVTRAVVRLAAAAAVALGVVAAGSAGLAAPPTAAPTGFTILFNASPRTCQVARIDLGSGVVTPIGAPQPTAVCPIDIEHAPDGRYLGVTLSLSGPSHLVQIDVNTGVITTIGPTSFMVADAGGLAFTPSGTLLFYGIVSDPACNATLTSCLYRIDPATGASTLIGKAGDNIEVSALSFTCDGRLLAEWEDFTFILGSSGASPPGFISHGTSTGSATTTTTTTPSPASSSPPPTGPPSTASSGVTPAATTGAPSFGTVDPGTGALTRIGPPSGTQAVDGMDIANDGSLWGIGVRSLAANPHVWNTVTIDPTTGAPTERAVTSIDGRTQVLAGLELDATCPAIVAPRFTG